MNSQKKLLSILIVILAFVACDQERKEETVQSKKNETIGASEISSVEDFNKATTATGTAKGNTLSGDYEITFGTLAFSNDCKASFVLAYDFFVDQSLSEKEVNEILQKGQPGFSEIVTVIQENGRITFAGIGDDGKDESGAVNEDGSFRIVYGFYEETEDFFWWEYKGTLSDQGDLEGSFQASIRVNTEEPKGSCSVTSPLTGKKVGQE